MRLARASRRNKAETVRPERARALPSSPRNLHGVVGRRVTAGAVDMAGRRDVAVALGRARARLRPACAQPPTRTRTPRACVGLPARRGTCARGAVGPVDDERARRRLAAGGYPLTKSDIREAKVRRTL